MTEEITPQIFEKLVSLASLELTPEEAEYIRGQLNKQLKSVHELQAIPIPDGTPAARHGVPFSAELSPSLRADIAIPFPNPAAILEQAPESADGYIIVPDIPHTSLG